MKPVKVNDKTFNREVLASKAPVLVQFFAHWCYASNEMTPILYDVAKRYQRKLKVCKVEFEQNPKKCSQYKVKQLPTTFIFQHGKIIKSLVGKMSKEDLFKELEKVATPPSLREEKIVTKRTSMSAKKAAYKRYIEKKEDKDGVKGEDSSSKNRFVSKKEHNAATDHGNGRRKKHHAKSDDTRKRKQLSMRKVMENSTRKVKSPE